MKPLEKLDTVRIDDAPAIWYVVEVLNDDTVKIERNTVAGTHTRIIPRERLTRMVAVVANGATRWEKDE